MTVPLYRGRPLPRQDWEGDDFTPGAGGHYVTCQDTTGGRILSFATGGLVDLDGKTIRAAVVPHDSSGISLSQLRDAIHKLSGRNLITPVWTPAQARAWLRAGNALDVNGMYFTVPRNYRFQKRADFAHAIAFVGSFLRAGVEMTYEYDPLDPQTHNYGRPVPMADVFMPFAASLAWTERFGYIPLEPIKSPATVPGTVQSGTSVVV